MPLLLKNLKTTPAKPAVQVPAKATVKATYQAETKSPTSEPIVVPETPLLNQSSRLIKQTCKSPCIGKSKSKEKCAQPAPSRLSVPSLNPTRKSPRLNPASRADILEKCDYRATPLIQAHIDAYVNAHKIMAELLLEVLNQVEVPGGLKDCFTVKAGTPHFSRGTALQFDIPKQTINGINLDRERPNACRLWFCCDESSTRLILSGMASRVKDTKEDDIKKNLNTLTASHLCHQPLCLNPEHLCMERLEVNQSRNVCSGVLCGHCPRCLMSGCDYKAKSIVLTWNSQTKSIQQQTLEEHSQDR